MPRERLHRAARPLRAIAPLAMAALLLPACAARKPDYTLLRQVEREQYGEARARLVAMEASTRRLRESERVLYLTQLGLLNLADGLWVESETVFNELYELLRLRGANVGTGLAATVTHEGVRVFRGEPYEQAMGYLAIATQKLVTSDWGNARAAANSAIELLDEFDDVRYGPQRTHAARGEFEYAVHDASLPAAYVLSGVANLAMGRREEAADYFGRARALDPALASVTGPLLAGEANVVVIADWGFAPQKVGAGPSGSQKAFVQRYPSDRRALRVIAGQRLGDRDVVAQSQASTFPPALDANELSRIYRWDALAGTRAAKAALGEGMVLGGVIVAGTARNEDTGLAGLGIAALGLLTQATAHADTRQIEILAQRTYVGAASISEPATQVLLQVEGEPGSRLVLPVVDPPRHEPLGVLYARLPTGSGLSAWATRGEVLYANDAHWIGVDGFTLPWILGGRDVRTPNAEALADYQAAGHLRGFTVEDLRELYRLEGIRIGIDTNTGRAGRHILEGGEWLFTPAAASTGYVRLFAQQHRAYRPKSERVRELAEQIAQERNGHGDRAGEPAK